MHRVLVVEDDPIQQSLVTRFLEGRKYEVRSTTDGQEALRVLEEGDYSVLLTDLEMPEMNGIDLIRQVQPLANPPVIIVLTSHGETDTVIQTFKTGIFDYILKPVRREELIRKIDAAAEAFQVKTIGSRVEEDRIKTLEQQISWNVWKENILNRHRSGLDRILFSNLHRALAQGAGFGSLISLTNMLVGSAEKAEDGRYLVDAEILDLMGQSEKIARRVMEQFGEIQYLQSGELELHRTKLQKVLDLLGEISREQKDLLAIRGHKLVLSALKSKIDPVAVMVDLSFLKKAFSELLLNALKFSEPGSSVYVLSNLSVGSVQFSFLNTPLGGSEVVGIPPEYEQKVLEPFYRIASHVTEEYDSLDHGLGLAVTAAIVQKHGGEIRISSVRDYLTESNRPLVNVMISLPLAD